jgi:inner membrane protein
VDPLTHALLGSAAARVALARPLGRAAWLPGAAGALLPDADAAIRSASDPLLYAEFHRHFTHSLAFVPVGGAVASLPWVLRRSTRALWKPFMAAAIVGYATHGPLDASTTYGTRLLWPFSDLRVAWNWISIIDPVFTGVLLVGTYAAARRRSTWPLVFTLAVCLAYLAGGALQRERALGVQSRIASARGHERHAGAVFPGFGNTLVWRSLYRSGDRLYMDRIRVPPFGAPSWSPGAAVDALTDGMALARAGDERRARDLERFQRFTNGWVAPAPGDPDLLGDARYSMSAAEFRPVWGIRFTSGPGPPYVLWVDRSRERRVDVLELVDELRGLDESYRPVP